MYKNTETGFYEADVRRAGVARLHLSYGVSVKKAAERLDAAVMRLFKGRHFELIELLRQGKVTAHAVADHLEADQPIEALRQSLTVSGAAGRAWPTVRAATVAMLQWIEENPNRSENTALAVRVRYKRFLAFLDEQRALLPLGGDTPLDVITADVVTAYQSALRASDVAVNTLSSYVAQVGALYRWQQQREERAAREQHRVPRLLHVPIDLDTAARGRTARERYLTKPEAARLLEATPAPLLFAVGAALYGGLRIEEVLHLRPGFDVDVEKRLLIVQPQPTWTPKTKKRRFVPIGPSLLPLVELQLTQFASEEWMLPAPYLAGHPMPGSTLRRHFAQIVTDAEMLYGRDDPTGVVFHSLRHTCASWLIMSGTDLYTVAKLLGNSLKMIEDTYGHLAPDFQQEAVARLAEALQMPASVLTRATAALSLPPQELTDVP